jgi:MFS transporter, DHA2 family, multidrug resistance protein
MLERNLIMPKDRLACHIEPMPGKCEMDGADGVPVPQRRWAILTVGLSLFLAIIDGVIANVALPTIARDVHASPSASIWVVNAYQLAIIISLLPLASLGEIYGYGRICKIGLFVFTLASLGCSLSDSLVTLTIARVIQGFGAAGIMSVNGALIRVTYPQSQLGRGVGINAMVVAVSSAIGPTIASAILSVAPWPWLFVVNVPIGAIVLIIALRALPESPRLPIKFDIGSAALSALTFGLLIVGIDTLGHQPAPWLVVAEMGAAVVLGFVVVHRQLSLSSPLLPVDLLRIPIFALSIGTSVCSFGAQMLAYVSLPFYLEDTLGRGQIETGLLLTPWPLIAAVTASSAGRLADRYDAGLLGVLGMGLMAAGLALVAMLPGHPTDFDIIWRVALCGVGFGLFQAPNNRAIMMSAPRERSGGASGMLSMARLLGQTTGTSLVALIFSVAGAHANAVTIATGACFAAAGAVVSSFRMFGGPVREAAME